ncbi:MAG: adenylate kinase [Candidatus Omnitrophica bacterium]|nr:adenylate kinase [Candidatus Omnitrophota bacterium]
MRLILLGPPGAGKGTQAKTLAQRLSLAHISTGDILRRNVKEGSALGIEAKGYMDKGLLVPDELVARMLIGAFEKPNVRDGFILDGYPRNLKQAETLDELLGERDMSIDYVIYLDASEQVIVQRLTGRRVCSGCNLNYHVTNMPPRQKGVCDACGGSLYQRTDDNETTVRKRLEVYKQEVSSLIDYYEQKRKLHRLCADEDAAVVLEQIIGLIRSSHDSAEV